jgi:transcriptional regulator with XRE-family HTH domain
METELERIRTRIQKRRDELGLSYAQLGKRAHMSSSTLQRYETGGIQNLPLDRLQTLADALETTPAYILGWDTETTPQPAFEALSAIYDRLNTEGKQKALERLEELAEVPKYQKESL